MALALTIPPQPRPDFAWVDANLGTPTLEFSQYLLQLDAALRLLVGGQVGKLTAVATPTNAAAAAAGVPVGGLFTTSGVDPPPVYIRTT